MTERPAEASRRPSRGRRFFHWVRNCLALVGLLFILYHVFFDLSVMVSSSMSPTLRGTSADNGDWVLTEKVSYRLRGPRRWEVVTFVNEDGIQVMKRVGGLPGETVAARDGRLVVNGAPLAPPPSLSFLYYYSYGKVAANRTVPCGRGYFVLGDYSRDSDDSRFEGPVDPARIRGRTWLVVWPPGRFGWVR